MGHVDDLKISFMDLKVVSNVIKNLKQDYEKVGDSNMVYGKVHNYLGMKLDFTYARKVMLSIKQYINLILQNVPKNERHCNITGS